MYLTSSYVWPVDIDKMATVNFKVCNTFEDIEAMEESLVDTSFYRNSALIFLTGTLLHYAFVAVRMTVFSV